MICQQLFYKGVITLDKPRAYIVEQVMRECNNFFLSGQSEGGKYEISSGVITPYDPDMWVVGQYIRLEGSLLHDGVYLLSDTTMTLTGATDEPEFVGTIKGLRPPLDFLEICLDVERFVDKAAKSDPSLVSESYRGYSYNRGTNSSGMPATWADAFADRLSKYRRMPVPDKPNMLTPDLLFERDMETTDSRAYTLGRWI